MKLKFKISLFSDYHIGAGYGKGEIDSIAIKDKDGLPVIRGTTLSGLLRQGIWELLQLVSLKDYRKCKQSIGTGNQYCMELNKESMCPLCRILGNPSYTKKWKISTAKIEEPSTIKSGKIVWRNRVNIKTRTSEKRKLFSEEAIDGKMNFIFTVSNDSSGKEELKEASFIVAAFRMIRNLGASRRRGKGQCQIHLIDITPEFKNKENGSVENKLLDVFKEVWLENKELDIPYTENKSVVIKPLTKKCFNVILLTKEPLLISTRGESGNRFQTVNYIPGYTFLGALAWKIASRFDLNDNEIYKKFISLFRRGGIKVTPLYPACKIGNDIYPSIPSPLDFLTCKLYPEFENTGHGIKGYADNENEPGRCLECEKEGKQTPLEPVNGFIPLYEKAVKTVEVEKREEMHIKIDLKTGKATTGDLFSYTLIESGQYFTGSIDIENWEDFSTLIGLKPQKDILFDLRIGKASSRGYGLTKVWFGSEEFENIFIGKSLEKRIDPKKPITMNLLTDAILVDRWGRFHTTFNNEILSHYLGVEVEIINIYVKSKIVDGFNSYLGLPKWRDYSITSGSSVGFKIKNPENIEKLLKNMEKLEKEGIGLRREQGFGKIAFNHPVYNKNTDVSMRIRLYEFIRLCEKDDKIKNFENRYKSQLQEKLNKESFKDKNLSLIHI